jgi:hypothetical protein
MYVMPAIAGLYGRPQEEGACPVFFHVIDGRLRLHCNNALKGENGIAD